MSSAAVKAGGVFVEIGADPSKFFSALNKVNKSLGNMGRSLVSGGGRLTAAGIGMAAPIAAAVRQGAAFESTLLNIRASTGATAAQIDQIKASSMAMSQALGVGPTEAANAFMEVVKAGVPLEEALNGVARTAVEFSKVAGMDAAEGAVILSKAMNAFGIDGALAANTLSAAADSSATTIQELSMAMSQVSAVAASSNQSIEDTAAALALLANKGIVSSDAGTSLKTMLQRLKAPSNEATASLASIGLSLTDLRDASTGKLLQLPKVIGVLEKAFASVDEITKDMAIKQIFGDDAVRAGEIFRRVGEKSFTEVMNAMEDALPVGEKYKIMMSGLAGLGGNVSAALQRMAIAVSDAVAPAIASVVPFITGFIDGLTKLATDNKEAVVLFAQVAAAAIGIGAAMATVGYSLQALSGSIGLVLKGFGLFSALASPVLLVAAGIGAAVFALYQFKDQIGAALGPVASLVQQAAGAIGEGFGPAVSDGMVALNDLAATAATTFSGIYDAVAVGDLSGAMEIAMAGMQAAFFDVAGPFLTQVTEWATKFQGVFDDIGVGIAVAMESASGFFEKNVADLGNPQAWGAAPAIGGVPASSQEELAKRAEGIQSRTDRNVAAMEADARDRSSKRIAAASDYALSISAKRTDAKSNLSSMVGGKTETRAKNSQVDDLLASIKGATSVDQLAGAGGLGDQFSTLRDLGRLTSDQETMLSDALDKAAEGLTGTSTAAGVQAGTEAGIGKTSVAGTFSSINLAGQFGGSSLAERTAKAAEETAKNTRKIDDGGKVAA